MSINPSEGIGARLARYRKLSGLSARELAERAGFGLTRGVIANIESGRKHDVTVNQLIALSAALGVPPVALALPIDQPYRFVRLTDGTERRSVRVANALDWFNDLENTFRIGNIKEDETTEIVSSIIRGVREHHKAVWNYWRIRAGAESKRFSEQAVQEARREIDQIEAKLTRLRVDLDSYKIDDERSGPFSLSDDAFPAQGMGDG